MGMKMRTTISAAWRPSSALALGLESAPLSGAGAREHVRFVWLVCTRLEVEGLSSLLGCTVTKITVYCL